MSGRPPTPEAVAAAMPRELTLHDIVRSVLALGMPAEVAPWVTEVTWRPNRLEVTAATDVLGATVTVSVPVSPSGVLTADDFARIVGEVRP